MQIAVTAKACEKNALRLLTACTAHRFVEELPDDQAPEVFGLHANADISKDLAATEQVLAALLATGMLYKMMRAGQNYAYTRIGIPIWKHGFSAGKSLYIQKHMV
jgi:hypothetical protein